MSLAMDALREQAEATANAKVSYNKQRSIRDELIRDARTNGVPQAVIMRITSLSRDRVSKISNAQQGDRRP